MQSGVIAGMETMCSQIFSTVVKYSVLADSAGGFGQRDGKGLLTFSGA